MSSDHSWGVGAPGLPLCSFHFVTVSKYLNMEGEVDPFFEVRSRQVQGRNFLKIGMSRGSCFIVLASSKQSPSIDFT